MYVPSFSSKLTQNPIWGLTQYTNNERSIFSRKWLNPRKICIYYCESLCAIIYPRKCLESVEWATNPLLTFLTFCETSIGHIQSKFFNFFKLLFYKCPSVIHGFHECKIEVGVKIHGEKCSVPLNQTNHIIKTLYFSHQRSSIRLTRII